MKQTKNTSFFLLNEDWQLIKEKSPKLAEKVRQFYSVGRVRDMKRQIDYCHFRFLVYSFQPHLRRRFFHLIHSIHCIACECYRLGDYNAYLVYDSLMCRLIMRLI